MIYYTPKFYAHLLQLSFHPPFCYNLTMMKYDKNLNKDIEILKAYALMHIIFDDIFNYDYDTALEAVETVSHYEWLPHHECVEAIYQTIENTIINKKTRSHL